MDFYILQHLIEVSPENTTAELVSQLVYAVDRSKKREILSYLINSEQWKQVLVFTRTKHGANRLAQQLERDGIRSMAIHGNKSQAARTKALASFKQGRIRVLVGTDVAARGLDIHDLPHVVNFELPFVPEDYVHRIGRTGRAGNEGEAISLVCVDEFKLLQDIEHLLKTKIRKATVPGFEPDQNAVAQPLQRGGGGRRNQRPGGRPQNKRSFGGRNSKPSGNSKFYRGKR